MNQGQVQNQVPKVHFKSHLDVTLLRVFEWISFIGAGIAFISFFISSRKTIIDAIITLGTAVFLSVLGVCFTLWANHSEVEWRQSEIAKGINELISFQFSQVTQPYPQQTYYPQQPYPQQSNYPQQPYSPQQQNNPQPQNDPPRQDQ